MSLENIDEKFDKVAKGVSKKDTPQQPQPAEPSEQETYEKKMETRKISGLLSMFENQLRQQQEKEKNQEHSDEEFRTVELTTSEVIPTAEGSVEKVTEEEIDSLIKFSKPQKNPTTEPTPTVDHTVYSQRRYDETTQPVNNVASIEDTKAYKISKDDVPRYTDTHPVVENTPHATDSQVGLPPINKTTKDTSPTSNVISTDTYHESTDENVSPDVMRHIEEHRKKRRQGTDTDLPDSYIAEDKN